MGVPPELETSKTYVRSSPRHSAKICMTWQHNVKKKILPEDVIKWWVFTGKHSGFPEAYTMNMLPFILAGGFNPSEKYERQLG